MPLRGQQEDILHIPEYDAQSNSRGYNRRYYNKIDYEKAVIRSRNARHKITTSIISWLLESAEVKKCIIVYMRFFAVIFPTSLPLF